MYLLGKLPEWKFCNKKKAKKQFCYGYLVTRVCTDPGTIRALPVYASD